jgi:hypothetical protein
MPDAITIPAPPGLPSNMAELLDPSRGSDHETETPSSFESLKDTADAKWDQVIAAFTRCSEDSRATLAALSALEQKVDDGFAELAKSRRAENIALMARLDGIDDELDKTHRGVTRTNNLLEHLNRIVTGVRSHVSSLQDMADSQIEKRRELEDRVLAIEMVLPDQPPPGLRVVNSPG